MKPHRFSPRQLAVAKRLLAIAPPAVLTPRPASPATSGDAPGGDNNDRDLLAGYDPASADSDPGLTADIASEVGRFWADEPDDLDRFIAEQSAKDPAFAAALREAQPPTPS